MTGSNLEIVDHLDEEFGRVAREQARRSGKPRRALVAVVAALAACSVGGAALAVSGAFDPADITASAGRSQGEKAIVMTGADGSGKPWQLLGDYDGASFCLTLRSGAERAAEPTASAQCGGITPGTLELIAGGERTPHAYGSLPDEAAALVLTGGGESRTAKVADDKRDLPGKFFVVELPDVDFGQLTVTVEDGAGKAIATEAFRELQQRSSPF